MKYLYYSTTQYTWHTISALLTEFSVRSLYSLKTGKSLPKEKVLSLGYGTKLHQMVSIPFWKTSSLPLRSSSLWAWVLRSIWRLFVFDWNTWSHTNVRNGSRAAVANVLNCDNVVSDFGFQSRYYFHFRTIKAWSLLPPSNTSYRTTTVSLQGWLRY